MNKGFVAISSVLVLSVVIITLVIGITVLSIGHGQASLAVTRGEEKIALLDGCAEEAIIRAQQDASYSGGSLVRSEGTCTVAVTKVANDWTVTITSADTQYNRTIQLVFNRQGRKITIASWQEL
jgi:hypothetical protein